MSMNSDIKLQTKIAGAALTIFRFVTLQTDGKYDPSGAGDVMDGICGETVTGDGKDFPMVLPNHSEAQVEAGGTIALGDYVESDATGKAVTVVSGVGKGRAGKALEAAVSGDIMSIQFNVDTDEVA